MALRKNLDKTNCSLILGDQTVEGEGKRKRGRREEEEEEGGAKKGMETNIEYGNHEN